MPCRHNASDSLRTELAHILGFPEYPASTAAEPYLNYITNRYVGRGTLEDYLRLVIDTVQHLSDDGQNTKRQGNSIQGLLDTLAGSTSDYFSDTDPGSPARRGDVEDTIMYIIGTWTVLLSSFMHLPVVGGVRKIVLAYNLRMQENFEAKCQPYEGSISTLSLHVAATRLNAYTLSVFGAVDIAWTHNISRHILLSKRNGRHVLELFALPCALDASTLASDAIGINPEYAQEIRESYSVLFNAWSDIPRHAKIWKMFGIQRFCWCWSCAAAKYRSQAISVLQRSSGKRTRSAKGTPRAPTSEFDPLLVDLMQNEPSEWTPELFPCLWSRIMALEEHVQAAKPWNVWILFRDRRDTLQFWTFLFATVVVMLTIVQVILGVVQVVGSFE
ncbi:hypothetical protein EK21DRAFT_104412 [Setomelanomma holmii]|uniref:Uncharacterized protein n=1 Tax=Setomelanomma holmii TaxID=210430 RepID=A0A9P4H0G9_9PLEO|nr:hypothetical protein EK21DRAFT_104412 [Setomelanomma holmii]